MTILSHIVVLILLWIFMCFLWVSGHDSGRDEGGTMFGMFVLLVCSAAWSVSLPPLLTYTVMYCIIFCFAFCED